jgi:hypothetical protein
LRRWCKRQGVLSFLGQSPPTAFTFEAQSADFLAWSTPVLFLNCERSRFRLPSPFNLFCATGFAFSFAFTILSIFLFSRRGCHPSTIAQENSSRQLPARTVSFESRPGTSQRVPVCFVIVIARLRGFMHHEFSQSWGETCFAAPISFFSNSAELRAKRCFGMM